MLAEHVANLPALILAIIAALVAIALFATAGLLAMKRLPSNPDERIDLMEKSPQPTSNRITGQWATAFGFIAVVLLSGFIYSTFIRSSRDPGILTSPLLFLVTWVGGGASGVTAMVLAILTFNPKSPNHDWSYLGFGLGCAAFLVFLIPCVIAMFFASSGGVGD